MDRLNFLKNMGAVAVTPILLKELMNIDPDTDSVIISEPNRKRIAIDLHALQNISGSGKNEWSAKEVLDIFFKTGILLYRKTPEMAPEYHPITVLD